MVEPKVQQSPAPSELREQVARQLHRWACEDGADEIGAPTEGVMELWWGVCDKQHFRDRADALLALTSSATLAVQQGREPDAWMATVEEHNCDDYLYVTRKGAARGDDLLSCALCRLQPSPVEPSGPSGEQELRAVVESVRDEARESWGAITFRDGLPCSNIGQRPCGGCIGCRADAALASTTPTQEDDHV